MVNVFNRIIPGDSLPGSSPAKNSCRKSVRAEPSDVPSRARPSLAKLFRARAASLSLDIAQKKLIERPSSRQ